MIRSILAFFGYKVQYVCSWGTYEYCYDGMDFNMGRPIHRDMGVAPPWAVRQIVRTAA